MPSSYDAVMVVSFGGPEGRDDVMPFLENVVRGKKVPRERLLEVAEHYYRFDGVSPINAQNRALIAALVNELNMHGPQLPVYWGNRNWHPLLPDALQQMAEDGIQRALAFVTSAFSSYSGCRQYREDIEQARRQIGNAPEVKKLRVFYNHPGFVEPVCQRTRSAAAELEQQTGQPPAVWFTAHSIPEAMAATCDYVRQLQESCRLVAERLGIGDDRWRLVYQSRSGPPSQPWLEPDVCDALAGLPAAERTRGIVVVPLGFLSDHIEVQFDLDTEAREVAEEQGIPMIRAATVGTHPRFVQMIRELICEQLDPAAPRLALGQYEAFPDECPTDCCRYTPAAKTGK